MSCGSYRTKNLSAESVKQFVNSLATICVHARNFRGSGSENIYITKFLPSGFIVMRENSIQL